MCIIECNERSNTYVVLNLYKLRCLFCFTDLDTTLDHVSASMGSEPFLPLEPPLSESDYSFTLGADEGLSDLFDFL